MEAAANLESTTPRQKAIDADLPASHLAESHLPALDGIRGVAVLMILLFHYWQTYYQFPAASAVQADFRFLAGGQTGVDLFFVLSGFLITGILLNAKGGPHFLRNFYMRRALRILPLYYLMVCGYFLCGWIDSGFQNAFSHSWWYFVYMQNVGMTFWPGVVGEPGHFWSLGVEEHFYLLWPILVWRCDERRLPFYLLTIISGAFVCRLLMIPLVGETNIFWFSPCRMDALALGALLSVGVRRPEYARNVLKACRWGLLVMGPLLLVLYPLTSGKSFYIMQTLKYLLAAVAFTALLGTVIGPNKWTWLEQLFRTGFLRWCGKYSYAIYVFHPFLYDYITTRLRPIVPLAKTHLELYLACEFVLLFAVVLFVSWASWHLFEKHFLKLKRFFEYSVSRA
jgi:peptidoglycan/LPS O-acetylase OafA/YrhL